MYERYVMPAVKAAWQAGKKILTIYGTEFKIEHKTDDSPLTTADKAAHQTIRSLLTPLSLPLLSEEGRDVPFDERRQWPLFWMVDPLDGTKEFIKRSGEFTVNIALIVESRPVLGVIYVPVQDMLFMACRGMGAFKCEAASQVLSKLEQNDDAAHDDQLEKLLARSNQLPVAGKERKYFTVVGSRSHGTSELRTYIDRLRKDQPEMDFISAGSSLKFCLVAEGCADQYPRLGPTMEWDTAAGQAIAECAGARVQDYETHQPLRYNKEDLHNPWFIVDRLK